MKTYLQSYSFGERHDPDEIRNAFAKANPGAMVQTCSDKGSKNAFFIQMIAAQTVRAELAGNMLANKPGIDFLLRMAGTTQISEAIPKVGSRPGEQFVLVIASLRPTRFSIPIRGGRRLVKSPLTPSELRRVEEAALLSARRG